MGKYGRAEQATDDSIVESRNGAVCKGKNADTPSWYLIIVFIIVQGRTEYFVVLQQCKGNPFLHFHNSNEHLCIVDNHTRILQQRKRGNVLLRVHGNNGYSNKAYCNVVCKLSGFYF